MSAKVEIYTWSHCPYSQSAKALLNKKEVPFIEYCLDNDEPAREKMAQRANGKRTMPQIFISDRHMGGCDDLYLLEEIATLDELLYEIQLTN